MRKVKIEVIPDCEEEIIIRCNSLSQDIIDLQKRIEGESHQSEHELMLTLGSSDYFVKPSSILFFEAYDRQTSAHTATKMLDSNKKLYELEAILPNGFMRVSKSVIINLNAVSAIRKDLTGSCEVSFKNSTKKATVSRMYYKPFIEKLNEMRLNK